MKYATIDDVTAIRDLCVGQLPDLVDMHDDDWGGRLGKGRYWREQLLLAACTEDGIPKGFCWVEPVMLHDHGIEEPWWSINAIAVHPNYRTIGVGRDLLERVEKVARQAQITTLHGICHRSLTDWYRKRGYAVLSPGRAAGSDIDVQWRDRRDTFTTRDGEGECIFFKNLPEHARFIAIESDVENV